MTQEHQPNLSVRLLCGVPQMKHWARVFAIASFIHLTLPDFDQAGWTGPRVVEAIGAIILLWRPSVVGFGLCLIGTLWPLLFLRDVLTQSMLLTWMAAIGILGTIRPRQGALAAIVWITAGTYWLAALHKMNTSFFNPEISCAQHAWLQVVEHWPWLPTMKLGIELALLIVLVEIVIGVLLIRRSPWAWVLGIAFHLPLTVTLAPAFGAVMLAGYAAALTPRQIVLLRRDARQHWLRWILSGMSLALLEYVSQLDAVSIAAVMKCFATGALAAGFLSLTVRQMDVMWMRPTVLGWSVFGLWVLHGLTPYIGIQYQHTAAMLSNLRIDAPCHNSLIFPESLMVSDPYIRIESAQIGDGLRPQRERTLEAGLWNYPALATMHRNWCIDELRPIRIQGSVQGRSFLIEDLCAQDWEAKLGEPSIFDGFQRFQKNLARRCEVPCIH